jgi:ATP-binding cassette subfamily B protein
VLVTILVLADAVGDLAVTTASARTTAWVRRDLLQHLLALGPRRPARLTSGEITGRLVGNCAEAGRVTPIAAWCTSSFVPSLGGLLALVLIDPLLAVVFIAAAPGLVGLFRSLLRQSSTAVTLYLRVQGAIGARLADALGGARTIAAAGTQDREVRRVLAPLPELASHGRQMWASHANIAAATTLAAPLIQLAVLAVAGTLVSWHRITPGELVATSQYVLLAAGLPTPLGFLARFSRARAGAARVAEVTAIAPPRYGNTSMPADGAGRLRLRGVSVGTAGQTILRDADLDLPAGALIAVIGRSGSGKSTVAALAGRLLDPDRGEVWLDGVALREPTQEDLRRAVAYGFDRPVLVGDTVAAAIALGCPQASQDQMTSAAHAAGAHHFIRRLPTGYATSLADAPLSGGEAQRIGLARAFVRPARLLILDDALSSVDTSTEVAVVNVLTSRYRDRTRLVVAHRVATAARADLVVWLDSGRVRRVGRHTDLWRDPDYRKAFGP